jgi:predicted  nucleic acid-binding Zn-ribbon protein
MTKQNRIDELGQENKQLRERVVDLEYKLGKLVDIAHDVSVLSKRGQDFRPEIKALIEEIDSQYQGA